jgi:hypothetical protein
MEIYSPGRRETLHTCFPFVLDDGRTGYAPENSQPGDIICQFTGCEVAAVLRERHGRYDIIGRAFVRVSPAHSGALGWCADDLLYFNLDIVTLQQLTATTDPILTRQAYFPITARWKLPPKVRSYYDMVLYFKDGLMIDSIWSEIYCL